MKGLTTALLARACRIFLELAYPGGINTIPPPIKTYFDIDPNSPLDPLLAPPVCQPLLAREGGGTRGYSLRLGSAFHPHLKLQIVNTDEDECIFSVDTHDTIALDPTDPDRPRWTQFQQFNRRLKEQIERAWEASGLTTFNTLLRRELRANRSRYYLTPPSRPRYSCVDERLFALTPETPGLRPRRPSNLL